MEEVKIQRERREERVSVYLLGKRDSYWLSNQQTKDLVAELKTTQNLGSLPSNWLRSDQTTALIADSLQT